MKTFYEFVDHKNLENSIVRAADLMVEMDIDPQTFILDYVSKDPDIELQEGFLDTIKNIGSGIKQFGQNVISGGGVKGGWAQAKDTVMGPGSKFDSAVNSLKALIDTLEKNDQTKNMTMTDGKTNLAFYMKRILATLEKQKEMIPRMQPAANTQPTFSQRGAGTPSGGTPSGGTPSGGTPSGGTPSGGPSPPPTT